MPKILQVDLVPTVPAYWDDAKVELMKRDRIMRKLIPKFGDLHLIGRGEPFTTLARSMHWRRNHISSIAYIRLVGPMIRQ